MQPENTAKIFLDTYLLKSNRFITLIRVISMIHTRFTSVLCLSQHTFIKIKTIYNIQCIQHELFTSIQRANTI